MSAYIGVMCFGCVVNFRQINRFHLNKLLSIRGHVELRNLRSTRITNRTKNTKSRKVLDNLLKNYETSNRSATEFVDVEKESQTVSTDNVLQQINSQDSWQSSSSVDKIQLQEHAPNYQSNKIATPENLQQLLAEKVTPLYKVPYEDQLKMKFNKCKKVLKNIGSQLNKIAKTPVGPGQLPCALEDIIPSPVTETYRNKDEFSIRSGIDGNRKTVGFFLDSIAENPNTLCVGADNITILKDSHKALAKDFENYMRQSTLDACINFTDGGNWRNIIARSNLQDEVMAIVIMHPQNLSVEERNAEKEKLKEFFLSQKSSPYNLKSLYFQECRHTRCTNAEAPFQLLFGDQHIIESCGGIKFRISPESFFQTNTLAAEYLMKVILNLSQASESSVILDICCGTGPVSFTFAPHVNRCIGIDVSSQAIEDAKASAQINNMKNVQFFTGKSENLISKIFEEEYGEEFIAVLNPARACLGKSAIHALRSCKHLNRVLYVSCNPSAAVPNFVELCRLAGKDSYLGKPFHPMMAVPVDLFPHTNHCELVILFQRL